MEVVRGHVSTTVQPGASPAMVVDTCLPRPPYSSPCTRVGRASAERRLLLTSISDGPISGKIFYWPLGPWGRRARRPAMRECRCGVARPRPLSTDCCVLQRVVCVVLVWVQSDLRVHVSQLVSIPLQTCPACASSAVQSVGGCLTRRDLTVIRARGSTELMHLHTSTCNDRARVRVARVHRITDGEPCLRTSGSRTLSNKSSSIFSWQRSLVSDRLPF